MLGVASRSDIKQQIATIDMTIEIYNLQVLGRVLGKLNQVPDVIDARRLHGVNPRQYHVAALLLVQQSRISNPISMRYGVCF